MEVKFKSKIIILPPMRKRTKIPGGWGILRHNATKCGKRIPTLHRILPHIIIGVDQPIHTTKYQTPRGKKKNHRHKKTIFPTKKKKKKPTPPLASTPTF